VILSAWLALAIAFLGLPSVDFWFEGYYRLNDKQPLIQDALLEIKPMHQVVAAFLGFYGDWRESRGPWLVR
jgi:hypothetical protein